MLLVVAVGVETRDKASGLCTQMRLEHVCGESCSFMGDCSTSSSGVHEKELGCLKGGMGLAVVEGATPRGPHGEATFGTQPNAERPQPASLLNFDILMV